MPHLEEYLRVSSERLDPSDPAQARAIAARQRLLAALNSPMTVERWLFADEVTKLGEPRCRHRIPREMAACHRRSVPSHPFAVR